LPSLTRSFATLVAANLSVERGTHTVLHDVSLTIAPGSCLGVVGPNGVGKSTLLRVLAGSERPDAGSVRADPPGSTIGYLTQEHEQRAAETVRQALHRHTGVAAAEAELSDAADALSRATPGSEDRYASALERFEALGAGDLDGRIDGVLEELGLRAELAARSTMSLSGGQAARVALAAIILSRYAITLLDEPTNDLDFEGLEHLEKFVANRSGPMVIVSHDRAFLENTIDTVLELDEHTHSGKLFGGGWSAYLDERATARRHAEEAYETYSERRHGLLDRARRERQWATAAVGRERRDQRDNDKAQRDFRINRTEQLASRARRTERAINRLEVVEKPWEGWDLRFTIDQAPRAGAVVARLEDAMIERGMFKLGPIDLELGWAERVALVGPNGSGKTSVVRALLGQLPLSSGSRWMGPSVVVGELGQDRTALSGRRSVMETVMERCGLTVPETRSLLAKFGLGSEHVERSASSLSPGERTRAELATFQARGVNFLVLDEPTNHLDLPAIEQVEEALAAFSGTLLLVTHDRRLLESVDLTRSIRPPPSSLDAASPATHHEEPSAHLTADPAG
jgi:ATPase subunit of ABC transporter with duplicated ATPase domains